MKFLELQFASLGISTIERLFNSTTPYILFCSKSTIIIWSIPPQQSPKSIYPCNFSYY